MVERFTIDKQGADFHNLRDAINGHGRMVQPGDYTMLRHKGTIIMSDTHAEAGEHHHIVRKARGDCLVTGLGMGLVLNAMLLKQEVTSVTVVELSPDVVKLVWAHVTSHLGRIIHQVSHDKGQAWFDVPSAMDAGHMVVQGCQARMLSVGKDKRAILVLADALTWKPPRGSRFHTVWHDIWPNICTDFWPQMVKLTRMYAPRLHSGGFQGCWVQHDGQVPLQEALDVDDRLGHGGVQLRLAKLILHHAVDLVIAEVGPLCAVRAVIPAHALLLVLPLLLGHALGLLSELLQILLVQVGSCPEEPYGLGRAAHEALNSFADAARADHEVVKRHADDVGDQAQNVLRRHSAVVLDVAQVRRRLVNTPGELSQAQICRNPGVADEVTECLGLVRHCTPTSVHLVAAAVNRWIPGWPIAYQGARTE